MVKNAKSGGYQFQESVMPADEADKFLAQKK